MALLRSGIEEGKNCVTEINKLTKELSSVSDLVTRLNGDANFQEFKDGTPRGERIYSDLKACVDAIENHLIPTLEKLSSTTVTLIGIQENLNKPDAMAESMIK